MKILILVMTAGMVVAAAAKTIHRSFRNGYPVTPGVETRTPSNASVGSAVFKSSKVSQKKTIVVTNRVTVTKEQAEKMQKDRKSAGKSVPKASSKD